MLTRQERRAAAEALMAWFESQEINTVDAGIIMTLVLAAIIGYTAPHDAAKQNEGCEIVADSLRRFLNIRLP